MARIDSGGARGRTGVGVGGGGYLVGGHEAIGPLPAALAVAEQKRTIALTTFL